MASLNNSKTLFGFTSPRTLEKIIPEIRLLVDNFAGRDWAPELQAEFFDVLFASEFYEGSTMPRDKAFAARERITRAPKALGFVEIDGPIALTAAGTELLRGDRIEDAFSRQLLKFQLPSPYHTESQGRRYSIKPYLELLRLTSDLGGITKDEIAIFFVPLTHIDNYNDAKRRVQRFRADLSRRTGNRKSFIHAKHVERTREVYAAEIASNSFSVRETAEESEEYFISTKRANMRDYADAFIRYLRATGLVTFNARSMKLTISAAKEDEVRFLLATVEREPQQFADRAAFKAYLYSDRQPVLKSDDPNYIRERVGQLEAQLGVEAVPLPTSVNDQKRYLASLELQIIAKNQRAEQLALAQKSQTQREEVLDIFGKISRKEIPDAPLYLEWNVWRALTMLNYAERVQGNFKYDLDGQPLHHAPANMPDIICEYEDFVLIVEVTLSSGQRQFDMEGEPIPRHLGAERRSTTKPVYCLFLAPNISEGTLAHFYGLNRINNSYYGGRTSIVPLSVSEFIRFFECGLDNSFDDPRKLQAFLDGSLDFNAEDETAWRDHNSEKCTQWLAA